MKHSKHLSGILLMVAWFPGMAWTAGASAGISTFDSNAEGWTITGDAQGGSVLPTYHASGGNPGGYISATDDVLGGVWYFKAGPQFHGDFSAGYGTAFTFDLRQSGLNNQFDAVDVYLRGGGLELTFDALTNPDITWTPYSIDLLESAGWRLGNAAPTQGQMLQVLGNLTDLQIRGEYITGSDIGDLDNVVLVPEPSVLSMLALGAIASGAGLCRRLKCYAAP